MAEQTLMHASSEVDVHAAALRELSLRGIDNPSRFSSLEPEAILGTCRWFDAQNGRVGTGVLVAELRQGGRPGWRPRKQLLEEQRDYGWEIVEWLRLHFPEFNTALGASHPAAIAAVIRLHWLHGKGSLTPRKHGPEIRAAAKRWGSEETTTLTESEA